MNTQGKRDYLRSQGFTVGKRGRFSAEMLEALKDFDEPAPVQEEIPTVLNTPRRDDDYTLYVATLSNGTVIKFDHCPQCREYVIYCHCQDAQPPAWLDDVDSWVMA